MNHTQRGPAVQLRFRPHAALQFLMNRKSSPFQSQACEGAARATPVGDDLNEMIQEIENRHVQEIAKLAHEMNVQHAKAVEAQRKEIEAKEMRIENVALRKIMF